MVDDTYDRTLSEACYECAKNELNETDETRREALKEMREWLKGESLGGHLTDLRWILFFLRGSKFNLEKAKEKIKRFHTLRQEIPEWFADRNPLAPEIRELLEIGVYLPLLKKDSKNRQVIVIRTSAHDPKRHQLANVFKVGMMISDLLISRDESISIHGICTIFDMRCAKLGHGLQFTPGIISKAVKSWETYPYRIKSLEYVLVPSYVIWMLNIFRSFMSPKLKSRVRVTHDSSLCDPKILPSDLGGEGESYEELAAYWKEQVEANESWFRQNK